ncbi:hypothetical protein Trydic_g18195, partial [Trypoxylus dichotomus]
KHKKHKSEKREREGSSDRPPGLKLILKVGSQNTPEHNTEWTYPPGYNPDGQDASRSHHKKSKKKKKKKDKNKDREKKHKHHHKDKKKRKDEASIEPAAEEEKEDREDAHLEGGIGSPSGREPRTCVLRQRQERSALQRMLEHLH